MTCGKQFSYPEDFRYHMQYEEKNPKIRFKRPVKVDITDLSCRICFKKFNDMPDIADHLSTAHHIGNIDVKHGFDIQPYKISKDSFTCFYCSEKFVSLRALTRHTQIHYSKNICETCGKAYSSLAKLMSHLRYSHGSSKSFCSKCKKTFKSVDEKRKHLAASKKCWSYVCPICADKFLLPSFRNKHMQSEHNAVKTYSCPECRDVFPTPDKRRSHFVATHTSKFKCECCGRAFHSKNALDQHRRGHYDEKEYKCDVCEKEFLQMKNLKRHMRTHMRVYKCAVCNKHFNQRDGLDTHMEYYHGNTIKSYS